jgi:hypothetical protein
MMKIIILFSLLFHSTSFAQDERFFRKLFRGELKNSDIKATVQKNYHFTAQTPFYEIDLNNDNTKESLSFERKDGESWLIITDDYKMPIFKYMFKSFGRLARLTKINIRRISPKTNVLILHFYEGIQESLSFQGKGRLYFLTIDNLDLRSFSVYEGPNYFEEYENFNKEHYHRRKYHVSLFDYNNDGIKEISVKHASVVRVYMYTGLGGRWTSL